MLRAVTGACAAAIIAIGVGAAPLHAADREHYYAGETFDCRFPKAGHVVIDTQEPNTSITVNGKRWKATSGSDFYQTTETGPLVSFGPGMKWWAYGLEGERATSCRRSKNATRRAAIGRRKRG